MCVNHVNCSAFLNSIITLMFPLSTGSCSSSQSDSMALLHPESSISCQLRFTSSAVGFSAHDVYHTHTAFDASTGLSHEPWTSAWLHNDRCNPLICVSSDPQVSTAACWALSPWATSRWRCWACLWRTWRWGPACRDLSSAESRSAPGCLSVQGSTPIRRTSSWAISTRLRSWPSTGRQTLFSS